VNTVIAACAAEPAIRGMQTENDSRTVFSFTAHSLSLL
jgi:hypothetical protein